MPAPGRLKQEGHRPGWKSGRSCFKRREWRTQGGQGGRGRGTEERESGISTFPSLPSHPPPPPPTASPQSQQYQKSIDSLQRARTELTCYLFVIKATERTAKWKPHCTNCGEEEVAEHLCCQHSPQYIPNPPDTLTFNQHALLALPFRSFYGNFIT